MASDNHSTSINTFRNLIERLRDGGNYFLMSRDFLRIMSVEQAFVVQHLINQAAQSKPPHRDGEWFMSTVRYMQTATFGRLTDRVQVRLLKSLADAGYIKTKKRGLPASRWIWIDLVKIETEIEEARQKDVVDPGRGQLGNPVQGAKEVTTNVVTKNRRIPPSRKAGTPSAYLVGCAKRLHRVVSETLKIRRKFSLSKWIADFATLQKELLNDTDRIEDVLSWYEANAKTLQKPRVQNARSFRKVFTWLEDIMNKSSGPAALAQAPPLPARYEAMVKRLRRYVWPKDSEKQLLPAIQHSVAFLEDFESRCRKRLKELKDLEEKHKKATGITKSSRMSSLLEHIIRMLVIGKQSDDGIVENHFKSVQRRIFDWDDWSGSLRSYILSPNQKDFLEMGRRWAERYSNNNPTFQMLLTEVGL